MGASSARSTLLFLFPLVSLTHPGLPRIHLSHVCTTRSSLELAPPGPLAQEPEELTLQKSGSSVDEFARHDDAHSWAYPPSHMPASRSTHVLPVRQALVKRPLRSSTLPWQADSWRDGFRSSDKLCTVHINSLEGLEGRRSRLRRMQRVRHQTEDGGQAMARLWKSLSFQSMVPRNVLTIQLMWRARKACSKPRMPATLVGGPVSIPAHPK